MAQLHPPSHSCTQPVAELAGAAEQLPVEIPLGREFVFHSIFACPVSRDQVSKRSLCTAFRLVVGWRFHLGREFVFAPSWPARCHGTR